MKARNFSRVRGVSKFIQDITGLTYLPTMDCFYSEEERKDYSIQEAVHQAVDILLGLKAKNISISLDPKKIKLLKSLL